MAQAMTIGIIEIKPSEDQPKIWFDSLESMAQVLSTKNRELLKTIKDEKPKSLKELADASGRKVSNLSRTLKKMENYGIVVLEKENRTIRPHVCVENFRAVFGL
ncbi:MAG: MarR family transcriptional regulator [Deltaproteobacteria bacterium]|nr:MarR family transcriptional regulator [Deltaproteobacteria bacterium]